MALLFAATSFSKNCASATELYSACAPSSAVRPAAVRLNALPNGAQAKSDGCNPFAISPGYFADHPAAGNDRLPQRTLLPQRGL